MQLIDATPVSTSLPQREGKVLTLCLAWIRRYGLVLITYIGATWLTDPHFMGDTVGYAGAILTPKFWETAHLLLYPIGWLLSQVFMPFTRLVFGADARTNVIMTLITINWLAGLLSIFMIHSLASRISGREWAANLTTIAFILSQGFLDYAQTGCSYVPGLALLLLSLYLLVRDGENAAPSFRKGLPAGLALAGAVGLWFPYVLSVPAVLAAPLFLFGRQHRRWQFVLQTFVAFALITTLMYGGAAALNHIRTGAGFMEGFSSSARYMTAVTGINGAPRTAFGLARSFLNVGNDGRMYKRFLLHDPLNPVSFVDLFRLSLGKLLLFYACVGGMIATLLRVAPGRRILGLLLLNSIPVITFGLLWQGGDMERYLPLYPLFFASLAYAVGSDRSSLLFKFIAIVFVVTVAATNAGAMAPAVSDRRQAQVVARIEDLVPLLNANSLVATINQQDEVWAFYWTFPFHPINRAGSLSVYEIMNPGTSMAPHWRERFASRVLSTWAAGGDMWISKRVLSPHPRGEWNWVEGDDSRVTWADLYGFFSHLEHGKSSGGDDGFWLLSPSSSNRDVLMSLR